MSTKRLGRIENFDKFRRQTHLSTSESSVDLDDIEQRTVTGHREIEDYPYEDQNVYSGDLIYNFTDWKGENRAQSASFEYRSQSGLFLLTLENGRVDPDVVLRDLDDQFEGSNGLKRSISVKREALWNFFERADQYDSLTLTGSEGRFDFTNLKRVANSLSNDDIDPDDALLDPSLRDQFDEPEQFEQILPMLEKIDLSGEIRSLRDLGIRREQYIIERAEVYFELTDNGNPGTEVVSVTYDRGNMQIGDDAPDDGRRYVKQLFEKEVVYPSYGR
ncbi:hypothetical protein PNP85_06680 [Halobacterium salinarum]|uniref:hypothetical protein n=1 Tax=Halobacterium TaxID=2239 RepID=UPI001964A936|nr:MULTISPECIES: hypothetical protein [Halobacterium]MCF2239401.1 hypothetical protein [Halobacterium salinarum]MDL0139186.1 hypothetical protein [Halobacterium salinarum]QRY22210.1 hypothetical protein JT689_09285 [Halobacterium sp. GSL-19]WJK63585.1 hypothetical protein QSJ49_10295 [Halobacterium salinarum]